MNLTANDFTYGSGSNQTTTSSDIDVTINSNDHSFTITPRTTGNLAVTIGHSTNSTFTPERSITIVATPAYITRIVDGAGNDLATVTKTISNTLTVQIQKCTDYLEHMSDPLNRT
jgi:hypothetical protein